MEEVRIMNTEETQNWLELHREAIVKAALERVKKEARPLVTSEMIEKAWAQTKDLTVYDLAVLWAGMEGGFPYCEKCGECCRKMDLIALTLEDIENLMKVLGSKAFDYIRKEEGRWYIKGTPPCPFLNGNRCSIYPIRPLVCRQFPLSSVGNKLTILLHPYCKVPLNLFKWKFIFSLVQELLVKEHPEISKELEEYSKKLAEGILPEDPLKLSQEEQFLLAWKLINKIKIR
jgi:Fe-S-cluster containining protein